MLANINQSHMKVFNRVLNGTSSRSGNTLTRTQTRVRHCPQQQKNEGEPRYNKEERSVSHRENLNACLGSKAFEEDRLFANTQSSKHRKVLDV